MHFTHFDIGNLDKGRVVEVHLQGNAANVYLLDQLNYQRYAQGQNFQAIGGLSKASPVRLKTMKLAHWHITVDLPGGHGSVKTSYRVLNKQVASDDMLRDFAPTSGQKRARPARLTSTAAKPQTQVTPPSPGAIEAQRTSCRACGTSIKGGKFCPQCGEPVEKTCPSCHTVNTANGKFCVECGNKLV